ncbi:TetR/AcrR family transcriptional regulator [Alcanivorax quisquiliarum]|uniref:TetR/AcrR family transcriptional regulator n=1 Tax=Alcanivorax quisquiliarum TaxID=2933565 RepID=A0ABT0E493_9GAMM|nr:TetR/AcrR family transcriptional regulator [Alcanivorax quisquiliarum]MCK0536583.1 TetR/AcrR family transcriptional regulator [Alcanivorax quisquiliarum]
MTLTTEDALLRSLARTLTENAGATLQEMATAAGVSRATLYRFAATREQLLDAVQKHVLEVMARILDAAGLDSRPPLEALRQLIANYIEEREFCAFMISQFDPYIKRNAVAPFPEECQVFEERLDQFFQRGQAAGAFRSDMPSRWLTDLFFGFIFTLCESEYRGRIARVDMPQLFEGMFLQGAMA